MSEIQILKKHLDQILVTYRDYVQPKWKFIDYKLSLRGAEVTLMLNTDGEKRKVVGKISAWVLLCNKYWSATFSKELHQLYPHGNLPSLLSGIERERSSFANYTYQKVFGDKRIKQALVQIGLYFLGHKQREEAYYCFWKSGFDSTLPKNIDEELTLAFREWHNKIEKKIWNGRPAMQGLTAIRAAVPFLKQKNFIHREEVVDFITDFLSIGWGHSPITAKNIYEVLSKKVFPLLNDPAPPVQYEVLCCMELWVKKVVEGYLYKDRIFFCDAILPYIEVLLSYGIGSAQHRRYRWQCLVLLGKYEEAEKEWQEITQTTSGRFKPSIVMFYQSDLIDWRIEVLARCACTRLVTKKISPSEMDYAERLINEAVELAKPRLKKYLSSKKIQKEKTKGYYAIVYKVLGLLRECQDNYPEALKSYKQAKEIAGKLGLDWNKKDYDEDIKRVTKKLK